MYLVSDLKKQCYKVNEVAEILGVSTKTIRIYDARGILKAERTVGNHRVILRDELIRFLDEKGMLLDDTLKERRDIVYARVSSHDQKNHGDLDRQALFLVEHVADMQNPLILKEVGSGLDDKRKKLQQVLAMVSQREVRNVYITYKDRLTRFGFHYLETMFNACGTNIVIVKDENGEKSVQEELVEDMMSLIASFSGKLYGLRSKCVRKNRNGGREKAKDEGCEES